jgi:hypothetical protein
LPHMAVTVVVPMVAADVAGHPPLHERAEGSVGGRLHDEVKMIRHQAEAEDLDGMPGFGSGEQVKKRNIRGRESLFEDALGFKTPDDYYSDPYCSREACESWEKATRRARQDKS